MTNQTPESVIAEAMFNAGAPLMHSLVEEAVAGALRKAGMLAEQSGQVCAWCPSPARGSAHHNDGKLHPSCGQVNHGQGWVPDYPVERIGAIEAERDAALVAAQGAARPVNSFDTAAERAKNGGDSSRIDREKLIARANSVSTNDVVRNPRRYRNLIGELADALAAQPVLDESKVAAVIEQMRDRSRKERDVAKESLGQFIARALCEAAKRGELNADR